MKYLASTTLVCLMSFSAVYSQNWSKCYISENRVSIEFPVSSCPERTFEGASGSSKISGNGIDKGVSYFIISQEKPILRNYQVIVVDGKDKDLSQKERDARLDDAKTLIGGDAGIATEEKTVLSSGIKGKEFIFEHEIEPGIYARGQVIDSKQNIFILVFRTKSTQDLFSAESERFFKSFKILAQQK